MQKNERWGPVGGVSGNPSARLRAVRSMPQWMESRGGLPPPPPPPPEPEPSHNDPDYEVIDIPGQDYSNTPLTTVEVRVKRCELCGASGPSVQCEQCPQQSFCPSCDEMYHRHPKRQGHARRAIMTTKSLGEPPRPPLPPKGEGLLAPVPVPPPRRNKKNQLPPGSSSTLKRETGIVGSIKRIISGNKSPVPPRPSPISRDRSSSLMNNNLDFHRNQMMQGEMEANGWGRGLGSRAGSMTALNMAPGFGPMMHAQSMAHLGCPGCWGWGSQAALHQSGMQGPPHGMHVPHGGMHGSIHGMHMPPPQPFWYPSWDPRRHRRSHHGRPVVDSSSDEENQPSPAMSRRSIRVVDSDSDDSFKKSRPHSRRESLADIRRREDDAMSLRGGRYDDDMRSLRGHRRDSLRRREEEGLDRGGPRSRRLEESAFERGGRPRRADDTVSERGGARRRQEDQLNDDRRDLSLRRREDDAFLERGGRRGSDRMDGKYKDNDSWERSSKRSDKSDEKYPQENSWDKSIDKRRDRYLADSDSDKRNRATEDKRQVRAPEVFKNKDERKGGTLRVPSPSKSSDTLSSVISSTSGEEKTKGSRKDRVFSDTGQRRRVTLDSNIVPEKHKDNLTEIKDEGETKESEEDMKPLGQIPMNDWECQHCTYVNKPGIRVCEVCCKSRTVDLESSDVEEISILETKLTEVEVKEEVKEEPKPEPQEEKKKEPLVEASNGTQTMKNVSLSSKGTSPPPQSISTQTYDVAGLGVKKTASAEVGWTSPRRSFSRQSIVSDTAQSGVSPTRSRSPGETDSQATESRQPRRSEHTSTLTRKPSRSGSLANEQMSNMVQKQVNQGFEMVKLLREAEEVGFTGEEVSVAVEHCGDSSPLQWLLENWTHMIDTVVTLATNYGHERKENTIGTVSEKEAKAALIMHQGSVWSAVTEVVQQRQNKYGELLSRGNFSREDIVTALTAHHGDLDAAYTELTKGQLKPFLRRIWAPNNHIGEAEEPRSEWDTAGRVQSWLTQHVYQSLPRSKQLPSKASRRHSDVDRFLSDIFSGQNIQPVFGDNRYASLHNLVGRTDKGHIEGSFGAPPERYTSCVNLHEASTRLDLTGSRHYTKQQRPLFPSRIIDESRNRQTERQVSAQDHLQEYKEKIMFYDRQTSNPDDYSYLGPESLINTQNSNWKAMELSTGTSSILRSDSQTDDHSEYHEDSKSEDVQKEHEDEINKDEIYNGRLQLIIQRNQKRKRRPKRMIKNYHSKFNVKSDVKQFNRSREGNQKVNSVTAVKEEDSRTKVSLYTTQMNKVKKDSTDEYESIESSEDETLRNKTSNIESNTILRKPIPKNERIILIHRESPEHEFEEYNEIENQNDNTLKNQNENILLDVLSDKESASKSLSEEIRETDYKELEGSFSNSIPFIDDEEIFSDANEDVQNKPHLKLINLEVKTSKSEGGSKSDDSSRYLSPKEWSESEKHLVTLKNKSAETKDMKPPVLSDEQIQEQNESDHNKEMETKEVIESLKISPISTNEEEEFTKKEAQSSADSNKEVSLKKREAKKDAKKIQQTSQHSEESSEDEYIEVEQESLIRTNEVNKIKLPNNLTIREENEADTKKTEKITNQTYDQDSKSKKYISNVQSAANVKTISESRSDNEYHEKESNNDNSEHNIPNDQIKNNEPTVSSKITVKQRHDYSKPRVGNEDALGNDSIFIAETFNKEANNPQQDINETGIAQENERNGNSTANEVISEITVNVIEEIEKGLSDEKSNEKVESHSEISSENLSEFSAFASGNLKTKIKLDLNRLSPVPDVDESSDKDVSPIPTDSEGDKSRNQMKGKIDIKEDMMTSVMDKREEMVTLIRESLSKDVILDRLVGTLLGVLQGGGATNLFKEQDLATIFHTEEVRAVKEMSVTEADDGMVSALQIAQDINVNPKEALQETILQCDIIKRSSEVIKDEAQVKNEEFQREVRKVLAEGLVTSYPQAELVVNLIELKFTPEEAVQAAAECTSLQTAISFLHQECPLCANKCTIKQMVGLLECDHRCCKECAFNYFNLQVTEGSVWDCVCPFCRLPDLKGSSQDQAQLYFSHLDILLKGILPEATHELFQRKLRDWTLAQDPNFKWCTKCSSGFIANPHQTILMCPDCRSITCAKCRKPWEDAHEGRSCEQYAQQTSEPESLLDKHLKEEGVTCPSCKVRYCLARGGCMHMTCSTCKHEFCSGCSKPFLMGDRCKVSEYCGKLGLHAHHPRNCLFYLRDKEPKVLEELLEANRVDYRREISDEESSGRCKLGLLKETDEGMIEAECSHPIHAQALCRTHYVEHLVRLVRDNRLDPATVMDLTEAQQELRRRGKQIPDRLPRQCDQSYLLALIKIVKAEIPLE